jgi:hypothetical protein
MKLKDKEQAALRAGLPAELAPHLTGSTPEELEQSAEQLAASVKRGHMTPRPKAAEGDLINLSQELEAARTRRIFGTGDTWKEINDDE